MRASAVLLFACGLTAAGPKLTVGPTGQYPTVQAAVDAAAPHSVIHIQPGVYKERVVVPYGKPFLTFHGDDPLTTVITNNSHAGLPGPKGPINTFATQTVFIQANDFSAENLTFENSAGNQGQAVALTIMGDRGIFRNCRFLGYQDTLLPQAGRQYFDRCYIERATDFIFCGSAAYFERCTKTFLGRPWRPWSATVFLNTEMSDAIRPEGWNNWNDPAREKTVRYAEYRSTGSGAGSSARVPWARQLSDAEAAEFTMENVLAGLDGWNPKTGAVRSEVYIAKGAAIKPVIPPASAWLAAMPGGRLAWTTGTQWTLTRVSLPAESARIFRGPDGFVHALWSNAKGLAHSTSQDLFTWSAPAFTDVMAGKNALDLNSPNLFHDGSQFLVTWSCTIAKNFIQAFQGDVESNPRIWYATTRDFETFSESQLLFDNNYAVRDAQILSLGTRYALLHNDNTWPMQNLRVAFADSPLGPWGPSTDAFTAKGTASPAAIRSSGEWWIYHSGGLVRTRDFWSSTEVPLPAGMRPVSVIEVPRALATALPR
ncbi:MAG: pectinesterase family protein [Candidatus Solibacter sp.]|nr:pectinesterase family protein [Candidatus Solibacter sp.]